MAYKKVSDLDELEYTPATRDDGSSIYTYAVMDLGNGERENFKASIDTIARFVSEKFNLPLKEMQEAMAHAADLDKEFDAKVAKWEDTASAALATISDVSSIATIKNAVQAMYDDIMYLTSDESAAKSILVKIADMESDIQYNSSRIESIINGDSGSGSGDDGDDSSDDEDDDIDTPSGAIGLGTTNMTDAIQKIIRTLYTTSYYDESCIKFDRAFGINSDGTLSDMFSTHYGSTYNHTSAFFNFSTCFDSADGGQSADSVEDTETADNATLGIDGAIKIYTCHLSTHYVQDYNEYEDGNYEQPVTSSGIRQTTLSYILAGEIQENCLANFYMTRSSPWKFVDNKYPIYSHLVINGNTVYSIRTDQNQVGWLSSLGSTIDYRYPTFYQAYSGFLSAGTRFSLQSTVGIQIKESEASANTWLSTQGYNNTTAWIKNRPFAYITTEMIEMPKIYTYTIVYHFSDCDGNYIDTNATIPYEYDTNPDTGEQIIVYPTGDDEALMKEYTYTERNTYQTYSNNFTLNLPSPAVLKKRLWYILETEGNHSHWNDSTYSNWDDIKEEGDTSDGELAPWIDIIQEKMSNYVFDSPDPENISIKDIHYTVTGENTVWVELPRINDNVIHVYMKYNYTSSDDED